MMKKTFILFSLLGLLLFAACTKDLMTYSGKEGVYFGVQWGPSHGDSTVWAYQQYTPIEFIKIPSASTTISLRVMVTGESKDYDRTFGIRVNLDSSSAVEGLDFDKLKDHYSIPAGRLFTDIPITLKRTAELQKTTKILGINLIASNDLSLSVPTWYPIKPHWSSSRNPIFDATYHRIELSDYPVKPQTWMGQENNGVESGFLGVFTAKKFNLICDLMNLEYEDFETTETMPTVRVGVINQVMRTYLERAHDAGRPILEEDGRLMWVLNVPWKSVVGEPYKPLNK